MAESGRSTANRDILVALALFSAPVVILIVHKALSDPERAIARHLEAMNEAGAEAIRGSENSDARRRFERHRDKLVELGYLVKEVFTSRIATPDDEFMDALAEQCNQLPVCAWTPTSDGRTAFTVWAPKEEVASWEAFFHRHEMGSDSWGPAGKQRFDTGAVTAPL